MLKEDSIPKTEQDYIALLQVASANLQECQKQYGMNSCFECPKLLDCAVRTSYVKAVYDSMNLGKITDFDF